MLLLSPSQRQSGELIRKVLDAYNALKRPHSMAYETQLKFELANGSRVICIPGREETIRSFSGVNCLILDEAARVPDDLYRSVEPMLAVSQGRLVALSTPFGQRGWFYQEWNGSNVVAGAIAPRTGRDTATVGVLTKATTRRIRIPRPHSTV